MKKFLMLIFIVLLCPIFLNGCGKNEKFSVYNLNIVYDEETHSLTAKEEVEYVNNSSNAFKEIYFHLYPNAFREEAKERPVSLANFSTAYPNGQSYGNIEIKSVMVENKSVEHRIEGEDENILAVPLVKELFPDESIKVSIEFVVNIPNVNHRFGYGENTINIANFYPIACVYEDGKGFATDLYSRNGDPFYSDVANYNVKISYDKSLSLASSGNIVSSKAGDEITATIQAEKVRDFAIVLSSKFNCKNEITNGVEVRYYYYNDETPNETLSLSVKALDFFSESFGAYPYKQLSVVQNNFVYGGMEYPNLVMISDTLSTESAYYVIVHEIAHQWWYGVVGNDEFNEAWVDESLTEYSTTLFFENHEEYGFDYKTLVTNANTSFKFYYDIYKNICDEVDTSMNRALSDFDTDPEYVHSIYTQGVIMYDSLRELIGEKKFYACCKAYYEKMGYRNASGAELISIFSRVSGKNLEEFFMSYMNGEVVIL